MSETEKTPEYTDLAVMSVDEKSGAEFYLPVAANGDRLVVRSRSYDNNRLMASHYVDAEFVAKAQAGGVDEQYIVGYIVNWDI